MNSKLFKKLNEKMKLNSVKNQPVTEDERKAVETKVVFEDYNTKLVNDLELNPEE